MWYLAFISFLLLGGYLLLMALRFGIPNMVSDTYYQLQPTTGSEIAPFKKPRNMGWIFSLIMVAVAFLMLICLLDTGRGIQFLAFLGCAGLCFVGFAPNYCDRDAYSVHKSAAIVAAAGCGRRSPARRPLIASRPVAPRRRLGRPLPEPSPLVGAERSGRHSIARRPG